MTICKACHIAPLQQHPELNWWSKCPVCGFSMQDFNAIHPKDHDNAKRDPYARRPDQMQHPRK